VITTQLDLPVRNDAPLFEIREGHPNIEWLVGVLAGRDWLLAKEILKLASKEVTDHHKRWLRRLADKSKGRIGGGQKGYKLITQMTAGEYQHWRNWMNHQADDMKRRIIEADRVFYARVSVVPSTASPLHAGESETDYAI